MNRYVFLAVFSGCLAGCNGFLGRILTAGGLTSTEIGTCRFAISAILYFVAALRESPSSLKVRLRDIWLLVGAGAVGQLLYSTLFFTSVNIIPLSVATTLSLVWPFSVIFLARIFFKEKLTVRKILSAVIAISGCAIMSGVFGGERPSVLGVLLALGGGLSYSFFSIFSRMAMERGYTAKAVSFYTWLFAAAGNLLLRPGEKPFVHMFASWQNILACLFLGVVVGYIANLLYLKALTKIDTGKASVLTFSSPVVSAILGAVIYREAVTVAQIVGILMILCAIALLNKKDKSIPAIEN